MNLLVSFSFWAGQINYTGSIHKKLLLSLSLRLTLRLQITRRDENRLLCFNAGYTGTVDQLFYRQKDQ